MTELHKKLHDGIFELIENVDVGGRSNHIGEFRLGNNLFFGIEDLIKNL